MAEHARTRRRLLATLGTGLLLGGAGCSSGGSESREPSTPATATATDAPTTEPTESAPDTADGTDTETESAPTTEEDSPGYKRDHWHGRLFFEVNGELVDFDRPRYYLHELESDHPEAVYFHFHEDAEAHGPNEWSNEKRVVTFQRALNLLPGIGYERRAGNHVVTYDGTTYDGGASGTSISVVEGRDPIDPTTYEVQHGDVYYVQVTSEDTTRDAEPAHGGADLGTLLLDLNNVRIDLSRERFLGPDAASEAFHFHDDGQPYMWYREGDVTLAEALNALPGLTYERASGNHVLTFEDDQRPGYSTTYDAGTSLDEITVRQRTTPVDPTSYDLAAGDVVWVYVDTDRLPENDH